MFVYPTTTRRQFLTVACLWLAAMAAAVCPLPASWGMGTNLDARVATWAYWHNADRDHVANEIMKMPGEVAFTLAVALALWTWHPTRWRAAGHLALGGVIGGLVYALAKWSAGRIRPVKGIAPYEFEPFINGWSGLLGAENMSFPSGHTTLAFATAACLAINLPRWRWAFYALAAVTAGERVCENAHYLSDVIAGAGVGTISAYLVHWTERSLAARHPHQQQGPMLTPRHAGA
jgi:membrane-associated phospholipid phosphatase